MGVVMPPKGYQIKCSSAGDIIWWWYYQGLPWDPVSNTSVAEMAKTMNKLPPYRMTYFNDASLDIDSLVPSSAYDGNLVWYVGDYAEKFITVDACTVWRFYLSTLYLETPHLFSDNSLGSFYISSSTASYISMDLQNNMGGKGRIGVTRFNYVDDTSIELRVQSAWKNLIEGVEQHYTMDYTFPIFQFNIANPVLKIKLNSDSTYASSATSVIRISGVVCTDNVIDVSCDYREWKAIINDSWLHLDVTTGGKGITTVTVTADSTGGTRTGSIYFNILGTSNATLVVNQVLSCV